MGTSQRLSRPDSAKPHRFSTTDTDRSRRTEVAAARQARRVGSIGILLSGLITLVSSLTPSFRSRLRRVEDFLPLEVHQSVFAMTAVLGLILVQLAAGLKRGQRRAWIASVGILLTTALLHAAKGLDVEESIVTLVVAAYLIVKRRHFRSPADPAPAQRSAGILLGTAALATVLATLSVAFGRRRRLGVWQSARAVLLRFVGDRSIAIGGKLDGFLSLTIGAVSVITVLGLVWIALRPIVRSAGPQHNMARARELVSTYGTGTLAYFALRDDKQHWILQDTLITYGVYGSVCLVSPDPVGPHNERDAVWRSFAQFATDQGWNLAVLGATPEWLPVYEAAGLKSLYVGDEGLVDVRTFTLDGGSMKGLRQAVGRIAKKGYTIAFHDPTTVSPDLASELTSLLAESRKGAVERGFSMTLSRLFDANDTGLLLAVATDPNGRAAAFCQYVPAGSTGFSLDLMRRSVGDHPNGLTDFVLVRTIEHLRTEGFESLSLNFATMRAVLAGEAGDRMTARVEQWALSRLSGTMQIESLWKYNAKFNPTWAPRYLAYDALENLAATALAVVKAESLWELPLIGKLLRPRF